MPKLTEKMPKWNLIIAGALMLVILSGILAWRQISTVNTPVPKDIRSAVSFPVYYPDGKLMPAGYSLDISSFQKAEGGAVIYTVSQPSGSKLIVSEVAQPGGNIIDDFNKTSIPLHSAFSTSIGTATIGAYGRGSDLRTIASLVINRGPWLIITAPSNTPQADMKQLIQSLRQ